MEGNKTATVVLSIIVVVLIIFGIYYAATHKGSVTTVNNTYVTGEPGATRTPAAPIAVTKDASYISQSTAVFNGELSPNGVQTTYWYEYGQTTALGASTVHQLIGAGYGQYSAPGTVAGLKASTLYYYRLVAQNEFGKSYGDVVSFKTTTKPVVQYFMPSADTGGVTAVTKDSATINGSVDPNNATTFYWFEYGKTFALGNATNTASAGSGNLGVAVSAGLSGLEPSTTYYYRLNAQNAFGTANGGIAAFTTAAVRPSPTPPGATPTVTTMSATIVTAAGATLNGKVNPNGSETTYYFAYGKSTLLGLFTLDQKTATTSAGSGTTLMTFAKTVTGLDPDSTYYFQLIADNKYGTTLGAIYSFTTKGS